MASARVGTDVPAGVRAFLRQQVRWKKSFIRNLCFTGGFMWRRGPGAAALYYGHVLWVLLAPLMAVRHLLWAPSRGCGCSPASICAASCSRAAPGAWRTRPTTPGTPGGATGH
ncbi:hypothetical protein ACFQ60_44450 [Streptomyces zhihengii]